jgi:hypothetical protein
MRSVVKRKATFLLVCRRGFGMENDAHFARFWLVAHLKGIIRSRYYEVDPPEEYFVASIRGYWSGVAETDPTADDQLISVMNTDPRNIRRAEAHCDAFIQRSVPASQYGFLKNPKGDSHNAQGCRPGPLPTWNTPDAMEVDGSFSAIFRVPSIGVMTKEEFAAALGKDAPPTMPDYLFREDASFAPGAHKIILCRDDVREGLRKERSLNTPLSALLHRKAYMRRETLADQLRRLLKAMEQNERFEVALLPASAFSKLELEIVGSFHVAIGHAWDRLHMGWKRRKNVMAILRKWLAGKELDKRDVDSAIVRNWDVLPRE